jgi:hypothetical protein
MTIRRYKNAQLNQLSTWPIDTSGLVLECLEIGDPTIESLCGERMILIDFQTVDNWGIENTISCYERIRTSTEP